MTIRYFVTDSDGSYIEWDSPFDTLPIVGQTAIISGNIGRDWVYVGAGAEIDVRGLGNGTDRIYLTGNLADYTQSISGNTYTLTRSVEGNNESITLLVPATGSDTIFFADGSLDISRDVLFNNTTFQFRQIISADLDAAAVESAYECEFEPAMIDGIAIGGIDVELTYRFVLEKNYEIY